MQLKPQVLADALKAYDQYRAHSRVKNTRYIIILDYTIHSRYKRLFVYDRQLKRIVRHHHAAHGKNSSSPSDPGKAIRFSNRVMSKCSSVGACVTGATYYGKYGKALKIHGLERGINDNMYRRFIVFHRSNYVTDAFINRVGYAGRSWGCPAMDPAIFDSFLDLAKNGVFCYFNGR